MLYSYELYRGIFKYAKSKGTKAAVMPSQVDEQIKTRRSAKLIALGAKMSEEFRDYYIGSAQEALLEEENIIAGEAYFTGYTKEYVKVAVKNPSQTESQHTHLVNKMVQGVIHKQLSGDVYLLEN